MYDNFLWGTLCAAIANFSPITVKEGGKPKVWEPTDFVPDLTAEKKEPKKQSLEEMQQVLMAVATSANAAHNKRKRK